MTYSTLPPVTTLGPIDEVSFGDGRVSVRIQRRWVVIWKQHTSSTLGAPLARVLPMRTRASETERRSPATPPALLAEGHARRPDDGSTPAVPAWRQDRTEDNPPLQEHEQRWQWDSRRWDWSREEWNWDAPTSNWTPGDYGRTHGGAAPSSASNNYAWDAATPWRRTDRRQDGYEPRQKRPRHDDPTHDSAPQVHPTYLDWDEAERIAAAIEAKRMDPGETTCVPLVQSDLAGFINLVKKEDRPSGSGNWRSRWLEWCQHGRRTGKINRQETTTDATHMPCHFLWEFICWYRLEPAFSVYCSAAVTVAAASRMSAAASSRSRHD